MTRAILNGLATVLLIAGGFYVLIWNAYRVDSLDAQRRDCLYMHSDKEKCK